MNSNRAHRGRRDHSSSGRSIIALAAIYVALAFLTVATLITVKAQVTPVADAAALEPETNSLSIQPMSLDIPAGDVLTEPVYPVPACEFETVRESIPYETVTVYDDTLYEDETKIIQKGKNGRCSVTYTTVYEDGAVSDRFVSGATARISPTDEIIAVGTIPGSRTDSKGYFIWPSTGVVSSRYGSRSIPVGSSNHQGLDIANSTGTDVWAADGGEVIYAKNSGNGYGNLIKILHDNGTVTYYAHLNKILVSVGDRVAQGEIIAKMGSTGNVSGPHLHFEVRPNGGSPVNPAKYLEGSPEKG